MNPREKKNNQSDLSQIYVEKLSFAPSYTFDYALDPLVLKFYVFYKKLHYLHFNTWI